MRKLSWVFVALLALAVTVPSAAAQGKGKNNDKGKAASTSSSASGSAKGRVFSAVEIKIIRDWFAQPANLQGLPPGLAKREQLPPGLQRQLERNGTLPPGLQKKIQPLPHGLVVRLPRFPTGIRAVVIAGNVILLEERTAVILDIVRDVIKAF